MRYSAVMVRDKMRNLPKFIPRARVRLRSTVDPSIYGDYACFGNEGVIGEVREDRFGLPEVFIQWDKNHWAYNGVSDCWTYEDHFELVEDIMSKQDKVNELMTMFAQGLAGIMGDDEAPQNDRGIPQDETQPVSQLRNRLLEAAAPFQQDTKSDEFARVVETVTSRVSGSAAFVVVGLDQHEHPEAPQGILEPFVLSYSKIPEGDALVTSYMARLAATAHQNLALEFIQQMPNES